MQRSRSPTTANEFRPQIGAIAVLMRGHNGAHGGVVSGVDAKGDPIIISRNHTRTGVGEGVYARSRVIAYVLPTEQRVCARGRRPSRGGAERRLPDSALLAAINAEARVPAHVQPPRPQAAPPPARQPVARRSAEPVVPHRTVQQTPEQRASQAVSDPFSVLLGSFERAPAPQRRVM